MMHHPTYRFHNQGAELRAQTEERGHCCSSMIESGDANAQFAHISPSTPISAIHVNSPTVPMSARYSTYISDMTVRNVRNGHGGQKCTAWVPRSLPQPQWTRATASFTSAPASVILASRDTHIS